MIEEYVKRWTSSNGGDDNVIRHIPAKDLLKNTARVFWL